MEGGGENGWVSVGLVPPNTCCNASYAALPGRTMPLIGMFCISRPTPTVLGAMTVEDGVPATVCNDASPAVSKYDPSKLASMSSIVKP